MRTEQLAPGERPRAEAAKRPHISERSLIWMMALLMALNAFGIDSILPALDNLANALGAEGNSRQFIVGAYLICAGIGALVPGSFAGSAMAHLLELLDDLLPCC